MRQEISLWGEWKLSLEAVDSYEELTNNIMIPGTLQDQGYGNDIQRNTPWVASLHDRIWYEREEYKIAEELGVQTPFLSQPKKHYLGKAWYGKEFVIEEGMEAYYSLFIELIRWNTTLWLNGEFKGVITSLCTPQEFNLGYLKAGKYEILLCVDNSHIHPYRPDGHMVSDALGGTFHGLAGEVKLIPSTGIHISGVRITSNIHTREVKVECDIHNLIEDRFIGSIIVGGHRERVELSSGVHSYSMILAYPKTTPLWDEYNPHIEIMNIHIKQQSYGNERCIYEKNVSFGFREIKVLEDKFYLNNRQTFFRGTHSGGDFPLTGYPSYKIEDWTRIFQICKDWGLNYMRFHSFCPPKAAFLAADQLGFYLQVECGMWNEFHKDSEMNEILWTETKKILDSFGNHPSFLMLSPSNEPGGKWFEPLTNWVSRAKEYDNRRIYTAQSGWFYPMEPKDIYGTDYVYFHRSGYGLQPGGTIRNTPGWHGKDYAPSVEGIKYPVISHELGQWTSYPDFDVIDKFTGYLTPSNYIAFKENARKQGVLDKNKEYAYNSGKRKVQLYKEDIEATFRTPSIYGFELLDLHDYIGQGTALVGMLDPFWDEKGFVSKEEFRMFCSETVPLLRMKKRIFTKSECINYSLEFSHFGQDTLKDVSIYYSVKSQLGEILYQDKFIARDIPIGKNTIIGDIHILLNELSVNQEYFIEIGVENTSIRNIWNFFIVEEEEVKVAEDIAIVTSLEICIQQLKEGKKVIYQPVKEEHRYDSVPLSSRTSFWNSQMGPSYARGMGIVVDKEHKALSDFPSKEYSDWQWSELLDGGYGLNLSYFPEDIKVIASPIDDWNRNYSLGLIVECEMNGAKLLIVSANITDKLDERMSARQLRNSLLRYVDSEEFQPTCKLSEKQLRAGFFPRNIMEQLDVKVEDEFIAIIDSNMSNVYINEDAYPLNVTMTLGKVDKIKGILYVPRQNDRGHVGDIAEIRIRGKEGSDHILLYDGKVASSFNPKEIIFNQLIETDEIIIDFISGYSGVDNTWYVKTKEGWPRVEGDYEDRTLAISNLSLLVEDMEYRFNTVNSSNELEDSNLIKSTSKEIDN